MATTAVSVGTMKVAQISKAAGDFELVERDIPEPGPGQVRVKVEACGICHSDVLVKEGLWPGLQYPRVPGHEIAGRLDALGVGVTAWKKGDRVGVGWHGGHDFVCDECRRGDFAMCVNRKVTGIDYDGGYAEYMIAPAEEAGPFMCAGVTAFNALRNSGARPSDVVAVQGNWRPRTSWCAIRSQNGVRNSCAWTWQRQRTAREKTRRALLSGYASEP
jgi:D-arabinose 1-dehydrogenase-like Zn-dependent alcohol dehydrogenase